MPPAHNEPPSIRQLLAVGFHAAAVLFSCAILVCLAQGCAKNSPTDKELLSRFAERQTNFDQLAALITNYPFLYRYTENDTNLSPAQTIKRSDVIIEYDTLSDRIGSKHPGRSGYHTAPGVYFDCWQLSRRLDDEGDDSKGYVYFFKTPPESTFTNKHVYSNEAIVTVERFLRIDSHWHLYDEKAIKVTNAVSTK